MHSSRVSRYAAGAVPRSEILHEILPNGLQVLLCEARRARVVEFQVWAQVGSADERASESGLAHFHEHMLFKGTGRRGVGEVAGDVEGAGGSINAYTSFDVTVYHATLPSDRLPVAVDVLTDAVQHAAFEPDEIEREIEVVLEEIRRGEDSPHHVLGDALFAEAFRVHPYRDPILGSAASVAAIDRDRLRSFFEHWYAPANLMVVATGDFDAPALLDQVRQAFGSSNAARPRRSRPAEPRQTGLRSVVLTRPFERTSLEFSYPTVSLAHADAAYLDLLAFVLGGGDSSRLVQIVRERDGLTERIDASSYTPLEAGTFSVGLDTDAARAPAAIEAAVRQVERVRHEPVSPDELEKARLNFLSMEHFERESVSGLAQKIGSFATLAGDFRVEQRYLDAVRGATREDLQRVAHEYLSSDRITLAAVLPESDAAALGRAVVEASVARGIESKALRSASREEVPAALTPRPAAAARGAASVCLPGPDVFGYTLPNGVSLYVVPRRDVPVVAARAAFAGGLLAEDADTAGLSSFTASMWLRGTQSLSAAEFARQTEGMAAEIDGFSGRSSLGLTLETLAEKLEPALELFAQVLLEPAFEPEEIEKERRETLAAIDRREDRLAQRAFLLFAETHYRSHPYRQPMLGTRHSVPRFDRDLLRAHHDRLIRARNCSLAFAGDVDPDALAERISAHLGGLDAGAFQAPEPAPEPAPREIRTAEVRKERAQGHLVIGFRGLCVGDGDRFALDVITQLLAGQGGRLFLELRDRRSLAYTVNAVNVEGVAPGYFGVYIATAPEKLEDARRGLLEELQRVVDGPPDPADLERAKRYLIGNFAIDQQRNATHAALVSLDALYGLGPDAYRTYPDHVESVTSEEVLRVARRVIDLNAYTQAQVRP